MAPAPKLVSFRSKPPRSASPLTSALREFIDHAIVSALVRQALEEIDLAKSTPRVRLSDDSTTVTLRGRRP